MSAIFPGSLPPSPGVGLRRKGPKDVPRLPLSVFTPSPHSDQFPLPADPSKLNPDVVLDAHVVVSGGDVKLSQWKKEAGQSLGGITGGVVVSLTESCAQEVVDLLKSGQTYEPILAISVPFHLDGVADHSIADAAFSSGLQIPISLSTTFLFADPQGVENLKWALTKGRPVDIDILPSFTDDLFEKFEDLLSQATELPDGITTPPIVLTNLLPPPDDLELPIVKLMNHPSYRAFQARIASLSLFPAVHVKFLPPAWDSTVPSTPAGIPMPAQTDASQKKEWKRRIKMYLGPVMEAFGLRRIMFGSSPSGGRMPPINAGEWYELARESLAELAVEQEDIDAVFYGTAKKIYTV